MNDRPLDPALRPERRFLPEALGYLSGEGRRHDAEQLLARLRERFRHEGRLKLADLLYEMAKACLTSLPDFSVRTLLREVPRAPEVIAGELSTLGECLASVDAPAELGRVARRRPEADAALADARKCLDALGALERDSGRRQLALALLAIHSGRPDDAEPLLRELLERAAESDEIRRIAEVNLAFSLVRQGRYQPALAVAESAREKSPDDPVPLFNLLAAAAELHDLARFEQGVERLRALYLRTRAPLILNWIEHDLPMLCRVAGVDGARAQRLTAWRGEASETGGSN